MGTAHFQPLQRLCTISMKDEKFSRPETAGVQSAVVGICGSVREDEARIAAATPLLDGLYAFFARASQAK